MENAKENASIEKNAGENPNLSPNVASEPESAPVSANPNAAGNPPSRTPFTSLGQVDADLALARALQEQERAYMMLRMEGDGGYGSSESGSYVYEDELEGDDGDEEEEDHHHLDHPDEEHESIEGSDYGEDAFDANAEELNPADFESDEAFARALQEVEERDVAIRLMAMAGLNDWGVVERGDHVSHAQDAWQDVDPDELSYEELIALGEVVGTESRGLSADTIASLPSVNYKARSSQDGNTDQCVICRLDYEDGDSLVVLSCKHLYHPECINQWLQINKVCPICSCEVPTTSSGQ